MADKRSNPFQFFTQVRQEARKITWPTWRETLLTTVMVLIMVSLAAVFFLLIDTGFRLLVPYLLSFIS